MSALSRNKTELKSSMLVHIHIIGYLLIDFSDNLRKNNIQSENSSQKCDAAQLLTYITTTVLHGTSIAVPKKVIFFSDPHDLINYKQGKLFGLIHSQRRG